jgi:hypothetical protein
MTSNDKVWRSKILSYLEFLAIEKRRKARKASLIKKGLAGPLKVVNNGKLAK